MLKKKVPLVTAAFAAVVCLVLSSAIVLGQPIARFAGSDIILENNLIKVTLSAEQGMISSWVIKATGQELSGYSQEGSKGLLGFRTWFGWEGGEWLGGWPTEIGRATYSNEIVFNSSFMAVVKQRYVLSEDDTPARGMRVEKRFVLRKNAYHLEAAYELRNTTHHPIDFAAITVESTVNTGNGGRLGWLEYGSSDINIVTEGQTTQEVVFHAMALEVESRDALFCTIFQDRRPTFAWLFETFGEYRDMEPHFGLIHLSPGAEESAHMIVYGGPGNLENYAAVTELAKPAMPELANGSTALPEAYSLSQNFPNPFNPETEIRFQLPESGHAVLKVFNNLGREVRTLVDSSYPAGDHNVWWDGKDTQGHLLPSGVYLYTLRVGSFSQVKKMSLLR